MSAHSILLIALSTLVSSLLVAVGANPPYTYTEGTFNARDAVFVNCTMNKRGNIGSAIVADPSVITKIPGSVITYINVLNDKPTNQQGTITKTSGGTGSSTVTFHLVSVESHGFLFHFDIRGRTPAGKSEIPKIGACWE